MKLHWQWFTFDELSTHTLYAALKLRQEVFVVEQKCVYLDCDGLDARSWHLTGCCKGEMLAYCRVVFPGELHDLPAIGRLLTHPKVRNKGFGRQLTEKGLAHVKKTYPGLNVRISAQLYLVEFYKSFGFQTSSEEYDEDGIPHIEMMYDNSQA